MSQKDYSLKPLIALILTGLLISIASSLETRVEWLSSLCGIFGDGCRDTGQFSILTLPIAYWGIGYYLLLGIMVFYARKSLFWAVMAGVGAELAFLSLMVSMKTFCFLCILNLIVVLFLFFLVIQKNRIWQALAISLLLFIVSGFLINGENPPQVIGKNDQPFVVAKVGDKKITTNDIETPLAGRLYKLEKKIYEHKMEKLKELIQMTLLEMDAEKKGISTQTLIRMVLSKQTGVTDQDVEKYYIENRDKMKNWKDSEEKLKQKIKEYLVNKKTADTIETYTNPLRKKYGVTISLEPPTLPSAEINIKNSPFWGPDNAPVTIVEFSDYMCPSCRRAHKMAKEIKKQYQGKIKWVFKDYPLKRHDGAKELAAAARCAGEQGKFWEYQDLMFDYKGPVDNNRLIELAEKLGLDRIKFARALKSKKYIAAVEKDIKDAKEAGVSSTPTFIINGKLSPGNPSEKKFKRMVDQALNNKRI